MKSDLLMSALAFAITSSALHAAPLSYFEWAPGGSGATASRGGISAVVNFITADDDLFYRNHLTMTHPAFVSAYGDSVPTLKMDSGAGGSAAQASSQISFSPQLPAGSRLFVFDVDIALRSERMIISSRQSVSLLMQLESQAGAASEFPQWSNPGGALTATSSNANDEEASVFDVSGVRTITLSYRRAAGGTGVTGASFAFAIPVPEPASAGLSAMALAGVLGMRRRPSRSLGRSQVCHRDRPEPLPRVRLNRCEGSFHSRSPLARSTNWQ
jgi:hypothetical protein